MALGVYKDSIFLFDTRFPKMTMTKERANYQALYDLYLLCREQKTFASSVLIIE